MKSIVAATVLAVVTSTSAAAQDFPVGAIQALPLAGSERLVAYAMSRPQLGAQGLGAAMQIYDRLGYFGVTSKVTDKYLKFSPILTWDGNLNGGQANDTFFLWGLPFSIDEEHVAKEGVLMGLSAFAGLRMNLAENLALDVRANAMYGYSPEHEISKSQAVVDLCARYMVSTETHLHACVDYAISDYELGQTERSTAKLGLSRAFHNSLGFHEVGAELRNIQTHGDNPYDQNAVVVRWTGAMTDGYSLNASVQLGEAVVDQHVVRSRIDLGATTRVFGRITSANISIQEASGGMFLAQEREETIYGVGLNTRLGENLNIGVSYSETVAKHEFFDDSSVSFSVSHSF